MTFDEQLRNIYPREKDIPSEFMIKETVQKEYLINGEIRAWNGSQVEVYSPVYLQGDNGLIQKKIGSYPLLSEKEAMEALESARRAYDNGCGEWPTMSIEKRIKCIENFAGKAQ